MKTEPILISYGTSTPRLYRDAAEGLRTDCEKYSISCDIQVIPSRGGRRNNFNYKPVFIKKLLKQYGTPVLWIDADSGLIGAPEWGTALSEEYDIGTVIKHDRPHTPQNLRISGGCLLFPPSDQAVDLLEKWDRSCRKYSRIGDHRALLKVLDSETFIEMDMTDIFQDIWIINSRNPTRPTC